LEAGFIALLLSCWSARAIEPDYSWLNPASGPRPRCVCENREDTIYHEMWYPDTNKVHAPATQAIMRGPWVFNRAMKCLQADGDTLMGLWPQPANAPERVEFSASPSSRR
jgi:hypothetical protein